MITSRILCSNCAGNIWQRSSRIIFSNSLRPSALSFVFRQISTTTTALTRRNGLILFSSTITLLGRYRRLIDVGAISLQIRRHMNTIETQRASKSLRRTTISDLRQIFALAWPYKARIALGLAFLGVSSTIFLATPRIMGKVIDYHNNTAAANANDVEYKEDIAITIAGYFKENPLALVGVLIVGACAIAARTYCMHTAAQLIINDLRRKVFTAVLRQDMAFFDKNQVGEIVSRLSTDALLVGYSVSMNLSEGARALITVISTASLMVYTSVALCKVTIFVIPLIVGTALVFGKLQRKYTLRMQEALAAANQVATERFGNVRTVRMLVAENREIATYTARIDDIWRVSRLEGLAKGAMFGGFQFTGYLAIAAALFYGSDLIAQGLLTYGDLSSFCLYAVFCATSLNHISSFYTELMKGLGASARLFELRNRIPAIPITGGLKLENLACDIRFESIVFAYPSRPDTPILNEINFRIPAGKITAVVGSSGSGKSTIASLLLRLYDPDSGRIVVDDVNLRELDPSWWRRQIGIVSQEPVLFSTTIWNNIAYAAEKPESITNTQIQEAAAQANLLEFIRSFPLGLQTVVGEHGSTMLSGGQKQRIAIARALITNPRMLIFDEATSALDATSEYLVRTALNKLLLKSHQTVLIIAHRLSTIKHADQIVVLHKGTVAEYGQFEELMRIDDGIFKKLVETQMIDWREDTF